MTQGVREESISDSNETVHPDNYKEDIQEEDQESSEEEIPESILEQFNFEDFAPFASDK